MKKYAITLLLFMFAIGEVKASSFQQLKRSKQMSISLLEQAIESSIIKGAVKSKAQYLVLKLRRTIFVEPNNDFYPELLNQVVLLNDIMEHLPLSLDKAELVILKKLLVEKIEEMKDQSR